MNNSFYKRINSDFFGEWNENMAYILGYFVADGCVTERDGKPSSFNITSIDFEHLVEIREIMESTHKIGKKFSSKSKGYQIQVRNKKMVNSLVSLGVIPRKTIFLENIEVPKEYFRDFFRGFFDGDGSVFISIINGTPQIKTKICCVSYKFIKNINNDICKLLKIPKKNIHIEKRNNLDMYSIDLYVEDSMKLAEFMYYDKNVLCLDRKRKKFEDWNKIKRRKYIKSNFPSRIGRNLVNNI